MGSTTNLEKESVDLSMGLKLSLSIFLLPIQYIFFAGSFAGGSSPVLILLFPIGLPVGLSFVMFEGLSRFIPGFSNFIGASLLPMMFLSTVVINYFYVSLLYRLGRILKNSFKRLFSR